MQYFFVHVAKQRKLSYCCPDCRLMSVVSSLCLSVFMTLQTCVLFACVDDLRPNQQLKS